MPSTYSTNLKIELMATGENSGTWGTVTNTNLGTALEQAVVGYGNPNFSSDANLTISLTDSNAAQAARALVLNVTSGVSLTTTRELVVPTIQKQYIVQNNTTGAQSITVKTSGGTGITVPNGRKAHLYVDGTNVVQMFDFVDINGGAIDGTTVGAASASTGAFTTLTASGATTLNGAVALGDAAADLITVPGTVNSNVIFTDNTYDIGASGATRPRTIYAATSIFAPLMDATNLEVTNIKANDGTAAASIADSTGAITVSTLLNVDNLRLDGNTISSTDVNGNVVIAPNGTGDVQLDADTVRVGDSNANVTITTNGTGDLILNTNSGTNSGSITIEDGVNGNIIIAPNGTGQVQITNAALDLTTIEVTNIKAKDGTASATIADSTGVMSLSANPILSGGTANGVTYLNASKVLTSGTALTFDGTVFSVNGGANGSRFAVKGTGAFGGFDTGAATDGRIEYAYNGTNIFYTGMDSASLMTLMARSSVSLAFGAGGSEKMRLTSAGTLNIVGGGSAGSTQAVSFNGSAPQNSLVVDASGNIGAGVSPSASWDMSNSGRALQFTAGALYSYSTTQMNYLQNAYYNGSNFIYLNTAAASAYRQISGAHSWLTAASGTAGNAITFGDPKMTLDSSGNLGLGVTPSAWGTTPKAIQISTVSSIVGAGVPFGTFVGYNYYTDNSNDKYIADGFATVYNQRTGQHRWYNAPSGTAGNAITFTQAMTLDADGDLGIGETNPAAGLHLKKQEFRHQFDSAYYSFYNTAGTRYAYIQNNANTTIDYASENGAIPRWLVGGTERARITSGGYFKASNAGTYLSSTGTYHELRTTTDNAEALYVSSASTNGTQYGMIIRTANDQNDATRYFLQCEGGATTRATIRSNGGLANYSANDVNLASDRRLKNTIEPMRSYYDVFKNINWVTWLYNDQTDDLKNHGVIAQELKELAPEFVCESNAKETPEGESPYLGIWEQDFKMAGMSVITELIKKIEQLEAKVAALESN
jgi:hypothetical protein